MGFGSVQPPAFAQPSRRRPVIGLHGVRKVYGQGEAEVRALDGVSLSIQPGEFVAIVGASGSGKSTMMNIIGCLDAPTSGTYLMDGIATGELDEFQLAQIRNRKIGFVFQSFNLIPRTRAVDNVAMPLAYRKVHRRERHGLALEALDAVGLTSRAGHLPSQLSGGQQQRVAIARALVGEPVLLLADEPTGALDTRSSHEILDLFEALHARGRTIVMITHEPEVAARARRVVRMQDGRIIEDGAA
ncbi:macrolide ABC transporter ATP-binding protein [Sinomonas cyclohexanicum]|uniref:Macrolide ABC transporter ATP-binding protein n=1 Tax=Sinomonas cyclohexanicum TaxID=322009 RepID=A0ABM7Q147_SINCY|nr:ABC transporter ATP-binding protein [Corynebacterium cyclohexanicum]BCT78297.1 macrolide ABC transporter ATP-binding protein [Corynebacterium cyclohexanicum]